MKQTFPRGAIRLGNWRTHPHSRWAFQNVSELVPVAPFGTATAETEADPGSGLLGALDLQVPGSGNKGALDHLEQSHGDAFVALREGRVVAEWYAPHCKPDAPHVVFSISKSITGLLAGIAASDGVLDPEAPVGAYVPAARGGAYGDATVRHLLDMTVSLDFEENYLDRQSDFDRYRRAMLWNPEHGAGREETLEDVLVSLPKAAHEHGIRYHYASPNTDMLGLVIERACGQCYHEYLAERLWKPLGARGAAYVTVDRAGTARAAGGICVTTRDLARLGQMVLDGGMANGRQIVPAAWIADMGSGGSRAAWAEADVDGDFPGGSYRSCWYSAGNGSLAAIGIHEQWLWIDAARRVVLVKFSSRPEPSDAAATRREIAALGQIARAI